MLENDQLTGQIIGAAIEVHRELGPGLLESTYEECLAVELGCRDLKFERQVSLPINYKSTTVLWSYRLDLVVAKTVIVEIKTIEKILRLHEAQLLTYMKLSRIPVGLLINFNSIPLKDGIRRLVLSP